MKRGTRTSSKGLGEKERAPLVEYDRVSEMKAPPAKDLEQYKIIVDIFKGYLDTTLTGTIWFYALTGAVVTNFLINRGAQVAPQ